VAERARRPRAEGYGPHPGGSGIMPAGIKTGARGASLQPVATRAARRSFERRLREAWPGAEPAGRKSRRQEPQVECRQASAPASGGRCKPPYSVARPARRLRAGIKTNASAGVPLSFYLRVILSENRNRIFRDHALSRKRVDKRRFVDETASAARADCFVA